MLPHGYDRPFRVRKLASDGALLDGPRKLILRPAAQTSLCT